MKSDCEGFPGLASGIQCGAETCERETTGYEHLDLRPQLRVEVEAPVEDVGFGTQELRNNGLGTAEIRRAVCPSVRSQIVEDFLRERETSLLRTYWSEAAYSSR